MYLKSITERFIENRRCKLWVPYERMNHDVYTVCPSRCFCALRQWRKKPRAFRTGLSRHPTAAALSSENKNHLPLTIVRHIHIFIRPRPIWNTRLPSKPLLCVRQQLGKHNGWTISGLGVRGYRPRDGVGRRRVSRYYFDTVSTEMGNPLCREFEKHFTVSRWFCTAHRTAVRVPVVNNYAASHFLC